MADSQPLTELQIEILSILWERGEASTAEVCEALSVSRGLALSTVATLLSRLEKREVVAHRKEGRQYVYRALLSRGEVRESKVADLTRSLFGGNPAALVRHLVASHEVDSGDLDRIRSLLDSVGAEGDPDAR